MKVRTVLLAAVVVCICAAGPASATVGKEWLFDSASDVNVDAYAFDGSLGATCNPSDSGNTDSDVLMTVADGKATMDPQDPATDRNTNSGATRVNPVVAAIFGNPAAPLVRADCRYVRMKVTVKNAPSYPLAWVFIFANQTFGETDVNIVPINAGTQTITCDMNADGTPASDVWVFGFNALGGVTSFAGWANVDVKIAWIALTDDPNYVPASEVDTDGDNLSDAEEAALGTNPNVADTDGDTYNDGAEVDAGTDPLDANDNVYTRADNDHDGLTNGEEVALGTDPDLADTDADGVNDGLEVTFGTDPLDPNDTPNLPAAGLLGLALLGGALAGGGARYLRKK